MKEEIPDKIGIDSRSIEEFEYNLKANLPLTAKAALALEIRTRGYEIWENQIQLIDVRFGNNENGRTVSFHYFDTFGILKKIELFHEPYVIQLTA